jgi:hypothetical protein
MNKSSTVDLLKGYNFYKTRSLFLEKEISIQRQAAGAGMETEELSPGKFELELSQLIHKLNIIESCLKMVGEYNERYKYILESHYINNVRIEDIADMTYMSRSRCYELCNEAISYMSRIIFGEDWSQAVI